MRRRDTSGGPDQMPRRAHHLSRESHAAPRWRRALAVMLVLLLAGVGAEPTRAADLTGTNTNDVFFFQGEIQPVATTLTNPYSGAQITVNGTYNVNQLSYEGLAGVDEGSSSNSHATC